MRVTQRMIERSVTQQLTAGLEKLLDAQRLVATGIRVDKASDDPAGAARVMQLDHALRALGQYQRNTSAARARLNAEESVLAQLADLLTRAKELGVGQSGDTADAKTRAIAAAELDHLIDQSVQLGNTKIGTEHIFGGGVTTTPPFQGTSYNGDTTVRQVEVGDGELIETNHTGDEILVTSDVLPSMVALRDALASSDVSGIDAALTEIDTAFTNSQRLLAETGGTLLQLDRISGQIDEFSAFLTETRSDVRETTFEQATTEFLGAQAALEAARAAATRVLDTALVEFLR